MITVKQDKANGKLFENLDVGETFEHKGNLLIKVGNIKTLYDEPFNVVDITSGVLHNLHPTDMVYPFDADLVIKRKES